MGGETAAGVEVEGLCEPILIGGRPAAAIADQGRLRLIDAGGLNTAITVDGAMAAKLDPAVARIFVDAVQGGAPTPIRLVAMPPASEPLREVLDREALVRLFFPSDDLDLCAPLQSPRRGPK